MNGLFLECAKGDRLLDAPEARPTLATAAALGVPVFVHPIYPRDLTRQVQAESIEAALARGEEIDLAAHAQISSTLTRLATRLGIGRKTKEVVPTLESYLAKRGTKP